MALQSIVTVTNTEVGNGGSNPETTDEIRLAAPLSLRANNRAVTLADFNSLAIGAGAGKANAVSGSNWTTVTLYLAPKRNATDQDLQPGLDSGGSPTTEFTNRIK